MLERRLVLQVMRHHRVRWWRVRLWSLILTTFFIVIVIGLLLTHKVLWAFVFVWTAILCIVSNGSQFVEDRTRRCVPAYRKTCSW